MTTPTPNGFAGHMFFEPLLRQFLAYQLRQLALNVNDPSVMFIDDLFGRWGDDVLLQVKKWLVVTSSWNVEINFPREESKLPFLSIVNTQDDELTREAYLSDDGGLMLIGGRSVTASSQLTLPPNVYGQAQLEADPRPRATHVRQLVSIPESRVTRLYIATEDVNETLYLYTIVKALLVVNKLDFDKYAGVRNLKLSGSDLEHKQEMFPRFAFWKVLTLAYDTNFDVPLSMQPTIGGFNLTLEAFLANRQ